jgi:hypothetical protein
MATYFLAPSLVELRNEINQKYANRDKSSDGWIGDASHAARPSDHNPDWGATGSLYGIVRAIDIDSNGDPGVKTPLVDDVLKAAIGDDRVWYVIWNRKIYSRTYGWRPRDYTGSNPHDHHVHVSIMHTARAAFDTSQWLKKDKPPTTPPQVDLSNVREQFLIANGNREGAVVPLAGVRRIKRALNDEYGFKLKDDGYVRKGTLTAWAHHEEQVGVSGRSRIPDRTTLTALSKGRFKVVL